MRECGSCSVCCYVGEVKPISPAFSHCPYLVDGKHRCGIYDQPDRPPVCGDFKCAWLRGIGTEEDRPDKIGAMFSWNQTPRGIVGWCIELVPDAIHTTARSMAVSFVRCWDGPLTVAAPGSDEDDRLIIRSVHKQNARRMRGSYLGRLDNGVDLYTLRRGG